MAVLHPLYCPDLTPFLFQKCKQALKRRRCGDSSTFQEQTAVVCSQTVEKMVDIFIRDTALKECLSMAVGLLHQLKHLCMM